MPVHDWTRVTAGTFHDFHVSWIAELRRALNNGILPDHLYAQAEQQAGPFGPDVLALERPPEDAQAMERDGMTNGSTYDGSAGGLAVADAPPRMSVALATDLVATYAAKRRTLVIRHATGDRIVALLEIVSPGNKDRADSVRDFVDKALAATRAGYHLIVVDLFPPRRADAGEHNAGGLCNAAFEAMGGEAFALPEGKRLCVAAFRVAEGAVHCYAEPIGVGDALPEAPLFYDEGHYVNVPLEPTYAAAWSATPRRWREVIEAAG